MTRQLASRIAFSIVGSSLTIRLAPFLTSGRPPVLHQPPESHVTLRAQPLQFGLMRLQFSLFPGGPNRDKPSLYGKAKGRVKDQWTASAPCCTGCLAASRPSSDTRRRSGDRPANIPGNVSSNAWRIHLRMGHHFLEIG
jgi:hypothetical protein